MSAPISLPARARSIVSDGCTVTVLDDSRYSVLSPSGRTYTVSYCGSGDADPDYVALWECNCPAGRYGKDCTHLRAFIAVHRRLEEVNKV